MMLPDSENAKVLLVEDNDLNRDMMQRRLARRGYDVIVAVTARDAIARARSETPELILIDLRLPDMSGWEAAKLLKSDPASLNIPLIALTAHAMEGDRERAMKAGCDEYEAKPIDLPRLLEKMQMLIERQRRLNLPSAPDSHAHPPPPP